MKYRKRKLGEFIEQTDIRNTEMLVNNLLGVSIEKKFIPSIANTIGTDFSKYKIVKNGQFAYGPVTSRNGDKISIALLNNEKECIVSSSYITFRVIKKEELNEEYLMILFSSSEFDRYSRYNSWGSARETFSWEDFCNTNINIPDIDEQKSIVNKIKIIENRINTLDNLITKLEDLVCLEVSKSIETECYEKNVKELIELYDKSRKPISSDIRDKMEMRVYPYYGAAGLLDYVEDYIYDGIYGLIAEDGSVMTSEGYPVLQYVWGKFWVNNHAHVFKGKNGYSTELVYLLLKMTNIAEIVTGAVQLKINQENLCNLKIKIPNEKEIDRLNKICRESFAYRRTIAEEISLLKQYKNNVLNNIF